MANIFGNDAVASVGGVAVDTVAQLVSQFAVDETGSSGRVVAITGGNTLNATPAVIAVAAASFTIPANTSRYISITAAGALVMEATVGAGNLAIWQFTANATTITQAVDMRYNFSQIPTVAAFLTTGGVSYIASTVTAGATASAAAAAASAATATTQAGIATADVALTHADVVLTHADVVSTAANLAATVAVLAAANLPAPTVPLDMLRVNAGGTAYEFRTPAQVATDIGALTAAAKDASGGIAGLTLFALNFKNVLNTFTSFLTNANTAARTYTFQDKTGTVGMLDDYNNESGLTQYYYPSLDGNYRDLYRSGWLPAWFNQQWGGSQWGNLPDGSFGSVATGNITDDDGTVIDVSANAAKYYISTTLKPSETATFDAIQVRLYKVGNPTYNLTARIYSDNAGSPNAAIGSASTVSAKTFSSKTDGEVVVFSGLAAALTANTVYHVVFSSLAAVDAVNYVNIRASTVSKYPGASVNYGTSVPAWTPHTGWALRVVLVNPAANSLIQTGGMFDYKLAFAAGTPANQSRSLSQPLSNFISGDALTMIVRGTFVASSNVLDCLYGIDHDRITLTVNASGFPVLTVYRSDRTAATITGTVTCATGNHDIAFRVRLVGDGADYATLYDNGASVGTPLTAQTFTFAKEFFTLGTARLGDGFGIIPAWTQDMQMTSLPSAQGWTWTGTGTEANCMSVAGGKLYQNANGYTSTQTGYYSKTVVLNNATGWAVTTKVRVATSTNTTTSQEVVIRVQDGTKYMQLTLAEYFAQTGSTSNPDVTIQGDFKSREHVWTIQGKGSDYYVFLDGKLVIDGTGLLTFASATNAIWVGDGNATASANADAIWSYVKYYQGGMILPIATTGTCSEFAHWEGDKSAILPYLYNSGTPVSIKQLCGVPRNYQYEQVVQREIRKGVASTVSTASTTPVLLTDMDCYIIGQTVDGKFSDAEYNTLNNVTTTALYVDGSNKATTYFQSPVTACPIPISIPISAVGTNLGLHKVDIRYQTSANSAFSYLNARTLSMEARS